jgi:hypothetical protein
MYDFIELIRQSRRASTAGTAFTLESSFRSSPGIANNNYHTIEDGKHDEIRRLREENQLLNHKLVASEIEVSEVMTCL